MALEGGWARVGLRPLSALLPHEETIPAQIQKVAQELRRDGMQRDPLIVDGESGVVLDGMHRLAALALLGAEYAVCCLVDYSHPGISVKRWARVYKAGSPRTFTSVLEAVGLSAKHPSTEAFDSLEARRSAVAAMTERACYLPDGESGLARGFEIVRKIDQISSSVDWQRRFVPEDEIDSPLQDGRNLVVLVMKLRKSDVTSAGKSGLLFPCKTSMHVVDPRPVGADVPLEELREGSTRTLDLRLRTRHAVMPANSSYGGRMYKERLIVLSGS